MNLQAPPRPAPETLAITTADGFEIRAILYRASPQPKAQLIVAGATGVPQKFYQAFAEFAESRGYTTLTLDYRGIGLSKPQSLKGFQMSYLDWAQQDLAAAVDWMLTHDLPLFMVGHSYGGHAFGLLPNHDKVKAFYTFGTGAGWHGWMPWGERLKVLLMWRVIGPLLVKWKGYLAWSKLGMGEDLPQNVFKEWRQWCQFPRYFFDDPSMAHVKAEFKSVRTPIVAANATDDLWALPRSRDAFMSGYPHDIWTSKNINPQDVGMKSLGHMGYFRRPAQALWLEALNSFERTQDHAT
jgi:predicted alpha/beta hydrolase